MHQGPVSRAQFSPFDQWILVVFRSLSMASSSANSPPPSVQRSEQVTLALRQVLLFLGRWRSIVLPGLPVALPGFGVRGKYWMGWGYNPPAHPPPFEHHKLHFRIYLAKIFLPRVSIPQVDLGIWGSHRKCVLHFGPHRFLCAKQIYSDVRFSFQDLLSDDPQEAVLGIVCGAGADTVPRTLSVTSTPRLLSIRLGVTGRSSGATALSTAPPSLAFCHCLDHPPPSHSPRLGLDLAVPL